MNRFKTLGSVGLLAVTLGVGASALTPQTHGPQGPVPPQAGAGGGSLPAADTPIALLGMAGSLESQGVETVITVHNDSAVSRNFRVEWLYDVLGPDSLAGTSGPYTIGPGSSAEFSTSNAGETNWPFFNNASRDTSFDFVGRARIYSDPDGYRGVSFEAFRLSGLDIGPGTGADELQHINVHRVKTSGRARQAGD